MQFLNRYVNSTARQKVEKKFPRSLIVKTRRFFFFFCGTSENLSVGKELCKAALRTSAIQYLPFFPHNETQRLISQHIRITAEAPIYT